MLVGDFNAHLPNPSDDSVSGNQQGKILSDIIQSHSLFVASTSSLSNGSNYTFFSGAKRTTVDYIITDASLALIIRECRVHSHHPLSLSDHLPITISLLLSSFLEFPSPPCTKINWAKSINSVGIQAYVQEISSVITPFLASILNSEIVYVCEAICQAAYNNLFSFPKQKRAKTYIRDPELKTLCKNSKAAWKAWCQAGCPCSGTLFENKQLTKKLVWNFVTSCHARKIRAEIQIRDKMFKQGHKHRFKHPSNLVECKRLLAKGRMITDPSNILIIL